MADTYLRTFSISVRISLIMALCIIILGAYVRLSNAGLSCPDWPGCYGYLIGVPETAAEIAQANELYPQRAVETSKAWKETAHRYLAGIFGILVLFIGITAWLNRRDVRQPIILPCALATITVLQALLGMWTVTLLLNPIIVSMHLIGGMTILSILWWLVLKTMPKPVTQSLTYARNSFKQAVAVTAILAVQILLGGWTSANYAALACTDFPMCQQQWWPDNMDFSSILSVGGSNRTNYEFGTLESPARTAIHLLHRIGAAVVALTITGFLLLLLTKKPPIIIKPLIGISFLLLVIQIILGISNVIYSLPLIVATAHTGTAALLLLAMITIIYKLKSYAATDTSIL